MTALAVHGCKVILFDCRFEDSDACLLLGNHVDADGISLDRSVRMHHIELVLCDAEALSVIDVEFMPLSVVTVIQCP